MLATRVIPCLTIRDRGLYRTVQFKNPVYVGDPMVALKILNEKEVDEIILLDISETDEWRTSQIELVKDIGSEAFMPMCYGGKVRTIEHIREILTMGFEKVSLNTKALTDPTFVRNAAEEFGSQSVVVSIDVRRTLFGRYEVYSELGNR